MPTANPGAASVGGTGIGPSNGIPGGPFPILLALVGVLGMIALARRRLSSSVGADAAAADVDNLSADPGDDTTVLVASRPAAADEAHVPRWRRPSVVAARFETDNTIVVRAATADLAAARRAPIVFADRAHDAGERMRLRYDGVPLLDKPDEALGRTRADLDTGDEVKVLERDELWSNVTTPTGTTGWVPTMVLAASSTWVDEDPEAEIEPVPVAPRDDQPSLEVLLAAIATERRARQELLQGNGPAGDKKQAGDKKPTKPTAKPRPRTSQSSRSAARPT